MAILIVLLLCIIASETASPNQTSKAVPFTSHQYYEYTSYYAKAPGVLKNVEHRERQLFLLARGAEIFIEELKGIYEKKYNLRQIVKVDRISDNYFQFILNIQDVSDYQIRQVNITGKLTFSTNQNAILASVYSAEFKDEEQKCDQLSEHSNCSWCIWNGRCREGSVPVDHWLDFSLRTQEEIQIDKTFPEIQFIAAHNAFNDRTDGYGEYDDCNWPPPYEETCINLANQEFSMTDLLNMGVHSLELDPWWCFDEMRLSHAERRALGCSPADRPFQDGIQQLSEWVTKKENKGKILRIYFEDGPEHTEGHDNLINGPIEAHLEPFVFRPSDLSETFKGRWPTARQLRKIGKTIVIAAYGNYTHGGKYIHAGYWTEIIVNKFTPYPACGGKNVSNVMKFYSDSTKYGPFWNGPQETGVILNLTEYVKCRIQYPASDQITPVFLRTGVFTWAEGEPSQNLTSSSCVFLSVSDRRWHTAKKCNTSRYAACSNNVNRDQWALSKTKGPYGKDSRCPLGFQFDVPHDGFRQEKLLEVITKEREVNEVWINLVPFLPKLQEIWKL